MKVSNRTFFRGIAKLVEKYEPLELETKRLNYDKFTWDGLHNFVTFVKFKKREKY